MKLTVPRVSYNTKELVLNTTLPQLYPNKAFFYSLACPIGCKHDGELSIAQYNVIPLSGEDKQHKETIFSMEENVYTYVTEEAVTSWWVNFTGRRLFIAYASDLFSQDEIQVAEHPVLCHLKEALSSTYSSYSKDEANPTMARFQSKACPVLIRGVERRCAITIGPSLYGRAFAVATEDDIWMNTDVLAPNTTHTNLICMSARSHGIGRYERDELLDLYTTAYTAFSGAVNESRLNDANTLVTIHTGHWGCGAYGGNQVVMVLIQQQAAIDAGIDKLVYHTVDKRGSLAYLTAIKKRNDLFPNGCISSKLFVEKLMSENYEWGNPDGQ